MYHFLLHTLFLINHNSGTLFSCNQNITNSHITSVAIAINASDIGAMGGRPRAFLVAVALPPDTMLEWAERLAQGLRVGAERYGASIVGGDVACVPEHIAVNVTAIGELDAGVHPVRRDGARPSNRCFVTGNPGRAAAGRDLLEAGYRLVYGQ